MNYNVCYFLFGICQTIFDVIFQIQNKKKITVETNRKRRQYHKEMNKRMEMLEKEMKQMAKRGKN